MRAIFSILIFLIVSVSLVFAGGDSEKAKSGSEPEIKVALVTDVGGIDDKSFNQATWEGVKRFEDELKAAGARVSTTYLQSESDADYIPNLSTVADEGYQLIVAPGFLFTDSIAQVSANYPDTHFLSIDTVVADRSNVVSAVFSEEQGSFLVGIAAGMRAKKDGFKKVGFIGGIDFDVIQRFEAGFEAGVKAVDSNMEVAIEYAGDFANPQIGQTIATKLFNSGINVIFHAAGATGNGLIKEAKDRSLQKLSSNDSGPSVWAIGVDKDQYQDGIYSSGKSAILTSMLKRVDTAAYYIAKKEYEGAFPGGEILHFDLAKNGVGIPQDNPNLDNETTALIEEWTEKIVNGSYTVPTTPERLQ